jgi:hypothetical protein
VPLREPSSTAAGALEGRSPWAKKGLASELVALGAGHGGTASPLAASSHVFPANTKERVERVEKLQKIHRPRPLQGAPGQSIATPEAVRPGTAHPPLASGCISPVVAGVAVRRSRPLPLTPLSLTPLQRGCPVLGLRRPSTPSSWLRAGGTAQGAVVELVELSSTSWTSQGRRDGRRSRTVP